MADNKLKNALANNELQRGIWLTLGSMAAAELASKTGFDWCLIDAEHGPNGLAQIQGQLMALAGSDTQTVIRVPVGQDWVLKQVLDLGAQNILVPLVHTAEQARQIVAATRYPPNGTRGMGATLARASGYGSTPDYAKTADKNICVMVQVESVEAAENIDGIANTEGVDVVFIGPADLSADMGFPGQYRHPDVLAEIERLTTRILAAGKTVGVVWFDPDHAREAVAQGARFVGLGSETSTLMAGLRQLSELDLS